MSKEIIKPGIKREFPVFETIKVSTKTFIASTNLVMDIAKISSILPLEPYEMVPKRRGKRKKNFETDPNKKVPYGSIVAVEFKGKIRGTNFKQRKKNASTLKNGFRNSFTIIVYLDKLINFKVCCNGTFQITGCKTRHHAEMCVCILWNIIRDNKDLYYFSRGDSLTALFIPAMRNIDFSLGFKVDREKLDWYMATQTKFHCILETSIGYTGVNIKIPLDRCISEMRIKKVVVPENEQWDKGEFVPYTQYLDLLNPSDRNVKLKNIRYNTFLVFHSGKVIMSGLCHEFMKSAYDYFLNIVHLCYDQIKENLD